MSEEANLREQIAQIGADLFNRGLTHGASGNISARLSDGSMLITPTGVSLGCMDPADISLLDIKGQYLSGLQPTKEVSLHQAFYVARAQKFRAVVHLHSCYSVAVSMLPDVDADDVFPPITAYSVMLLGRVKLLPYFRPGDSAMGDAVRDLAGDRSAVILANHGPIVAAKDLRTAQFAMEELEATSKLLLLTRGLGPKLLTAEQVFDLRQHFNLE